MATWNDVKGHIKNKFSVNDEGGFISFLVEYKSGRSQAVLIGMRDVDGEEWIHIYSPVGNISANKLPAVLEAMDVSDAGGLVKLSDTYYVRHCAPVADMSAEELEGPLYMVAAIADVLENKFVGGDNM
jgi:hypothetical protein